MYMIINVYQNYINKRCLVLLKAKKKNFAISKQIIVYVYVYILLKIFLYF